MASHTTHDHLSPADRAEQDRISAADAQRRSSTQSAKLRPVDTFEALEKHQEEVKADEEARTKAFEDSARGKRIKANSERAAKDANGKEVEHLSEEDAKKASREAMPPAVKEDGTIDLPAGAALPPAVREPYWPSAPAWAQPLAEPPPEDIGTPVANSKKAHAHAAA
jgi:hypothetical protein